MMNSFVVIYWILLAIFSPVSYCCLSLMMNGVVIMVKVSVLMPVYNTPEEYLRPAMESILAQTYRDFEFVIPRNK